MNYLDKYKARLNMCGKNETEQFQNFGRSNFESFLKSAPNKVYINKGADTIVGATYLEKYKNYDETTNYLMTRLEDTLDNGFIYTDSYLSEWIILSNENINPPSYNRYVVLKCDNTLKFIDGYGVLQEISCHITGSLSNKLLEVFKIKNKILEPQDSGVAFVFAPLTNIKKGQRFIINQTAWKVSNYDKISVKNVMFITLVEDKIDMQNDDLINEIAGYKNTEWRIDLPTDHYEIEIGKELYIEPIIYHNGSIVKEEIIFNNTSNFILNGNCLTCNDIGSYNLSISLKNSPSISREIFINVVEIIQQERITYDIIGKEKIRKGRSSNYNAYCYINGAIEPMEVKYQVIDLDGLVDIVFDGGLHIKAKEQGGNGVITIIATFVNDTVVQKQVEIVSLWS